MEDLSQIYSHRFSEKERLSKDRIWRVLCRHFFQRYIRPADTVLDLAAGYCEFINNIQGAQRIAVDLNPDAHNYAQPGVRVVVASSTQMSVIEAESVDVVFVSNFFEHLPDKTAFMKTLNEIYRILKDGGKLLILQPNIRVLGGQYWDFIDHHLPLTDRTLVEALELTGMRVAEVRPRFLPYTTKSWLPSYPFLVWLYLMLPPAQWLLGGQAWVVGIKP